MHCIRSLFSIFCALTASFASGADRSGVQLLERLVEINSGTNNVEGVARVQEITRDELEKLGFQTEFLSNPKNKESKARILFAKRAGAGKSIVRLLAHADTVFEKDSPFQKFDLSEDGAIAKGPGVIDNKGGIVVMLLALKKAAPEKLPTIQVMVTPSEETSNADFLDVVVAQGAPQFTLGFEPAMEDGSIITQRKGSLTWEIFVEGKEAHSGRAQDKGVNACQELAIKVDQLARLTDYKRGMTVNIGHIEGGQDKSNIVCGLARAKIGTRFLNIADQKELQTKIEKILSISSVKSFATHEPTRIRFEHGDGSPPFQMKKAGKKIADKHLAILSRLEGRKVTAAVSGGAGDINLFVGDSIGIDGLGPVGSGLHTPEESLMVKSLETRSSAVAEFLENL